MFPLGLVAVIDRHTANDGGWGVLIGCYAAYLVQGFFYFRSKTTTRTVILYGVLVVLLVGNVAGCREIIHSHCADQAICSKKLLHTMMSTQPLAPTAAF